ncbi:hypothetical protein DL765_004954 [Monosporascus sp. GIB2]|nr:hypothetical protein DL765_004954 [Monosporascus sp. GIB2]
MDYDFKKWWDHLRNPMVSRWGEAVALDRLRAAVRYRLENSDQESLAIQFLQYQIIGDLYRTICRHNPMSIPSLRVLTIVILDSGQRSTRATATPGPPAVRAKDRERDLDALGYGRERRPGYFAQAIETNAAEYDKGTRNVAASPATTPSAAAARRFESSGASNQAASTSSRSPVPPQPPAQQGGLADSIWAPGKGGAQNLQTGTQNQASAPSTSPQLPGLLPPSPTPTAPRLTNLGQAVRTVTAQGLQHKAQQELEAKTKLLHAKIPEPTEAGGGPWEILLPRSVDPAGSIAPYRQVLEDLLGRLSAYSALAAYVKYSHDTGAAPDIVDFLLARQLDVINKLRAEHTELGATKQAILGSKVAAPVAPHGEYVKYSAEHAERREGQAPRKDNKTTGEGEASRVNEIVGGRKAPRRGKPSFRHALY